MIVNKQLKMMGTIIDIQIESDKAEQQIAKVCDLFETYNQRFSANDDSSELMEINQNAGLKSVRVNPELFELIEIGKYHSLADPSNLNIAIGPLVQTWRIGFSDAKVPEDCTIQEKLMLTSPNDIILDREKKSVFLAKKGMKIDLGALAKGYIADAIMSYLISDGITSALLNLGGNVLVHGPNHKRADQLFYIGIQNPQEKKRGNNLGILKIKNQSVVTSGIYERTLTVNNKKYHHIFDKETGYPIASQMASLTIVADKSVDCEIWTTRLFGLDPMIVYMTINHLPGVEGIIITQSNQLVVTDGLKHSFFLTYH